MVSFSDFLASRLMSLKESHLETHNQHNVQEPNQQNRVITTVEHFQTWWLTPRKIQRNDSDSISGFQSLIKPLAASAVACQVPLATSTTTTQNADNLDGDSTKQYDYVSYISPKTIVTETVYHFIRGCVYGTAYACVTPFYMTGTAGAALEHKTGLFKPAPVFSTLPWSIPSHALFIGSILACQRFGCKSMEYVRAKSDPWNDTFGYFLVVPYYQICLTKHAVWHNRIVGGAILGCAILANWP